MNQYAKTLQGMIVKGQERRARRFIRKRKIKSRIVDRAAWAAGQALQVRYGGRA